MNKMPSLMPFYYLVVIMCALAAGVDFVVGRYWLGLLNIGFIVLNLWASTYYKKTLRDKHARENEDLNSKESK